MPRHRRRLTVLLGVRAAGRHGPRRRCDPPPAEDPDAGFLEFLGSVDGLAEVNPDYLSQANAARPPPGSRRAAAPPSSRRRAACTAAARERRRESKNNE